MSNAGQHPGYPPHLPPASGGGVQHGGQPPGSRVRAIVVSSIASAVVVFLAAAGATTYIVDPFNWFHAAHGPAPTMQAIGDSGPDPFAGSFTNRDLSITGDSAIKLAAQTHVDVTHGSVAGNAQGLYGGSLDLQTCDANGVMNFLKANADKRAAWLQVEGVSEDNLESFITGLTAVVLLRDTWVTNHGFVNGTANPFQAVLQAGTAVLVDNTGLPRVRCECGNPLGAPQTALADPAGAKSPWAGYNAGQVVQVNAAEKFDTISVVDVSNGRIIQRGTGIGRAGAVQVTLTWSTDADLDVHVIDPRGTEIYYQNKTSGSGGELDVDKIPESGDVTQHVENIFWTSSAPKGTYTAFIRDYNSRSTTNNSYVMKVYVAGALVRTQTGSLTDNQNGPRVAFTVT